MAVVLGDSGKLQEAEAEFRKIIAARSGKQHRGLPGTLGLASSYNMLADNLVSQRRANEALAAARQALAVLEQGGVDDQAAFSSVWNSIAYAEWAGGDCKAGIEHARRAIALATAAGAKNRLKAHQLTLSRCLAQQAATADEALQLTAAVIAASAPDSGWTHSARAVQAEALWAQGKHAQATALAEKVLPTLSNWSTARPRLQALLQGHAPHG